MLSLIENFSIFLLEQLPELSQDQLKASGIGRAVMFLYRHPRESSANRKIAGKLISELFLCCAEKCYAVFLYSFPQIVCFLLL